MGKVEKEVSLKKQRVLAALDSILQALKPTTKASRKEMMRAKVKKIALKEGTKGVKKFKIAKKKKDRGFGARVKKQLLTTATASASSLAIGYTKEVVLADFFKKFSYESSRRSSRNKMVGGSGMEGVRLTKEQLREIINRTTEISKRAEIANKKTRQVEGEAGFFGIVADKLKQNYF